MASMSDVSSIDIPAGATGKFAPGGYQLMCMDPTSAIKPGSEISVSLEIADGSKVQSEFAVHTQSGKWLRIAAGHCDGI
jgi:copper(I)-binding protein